LSRKFPRTTEKEFRDEIFRATRSRIFLARKTAEVMTQVEKVFIFISKNNN